MKKLVVTIHTFERWKVDKDLAMNTTMCLTYDKMTTNHECVDVPKCLWCISVLLAHFLLVRMVLVVMGLILLI